MDDKWTIWYATSRTFARRDRGCVLPISIFSTLTGSAATYLGQRAHVYPHSIVSSKLLTASVVH